MISQRFGYLGKCFLILLIALIYIPSWAFATEYYISPTGDDTNSGTTRELAFKSIAKALDVVYDSNHSANDVITVHVLPGTYTGQYKGIVLGKSLPTVKIVGEIKNGLRPVFSNGGIHKEWITLYAKDGQKLNLTIENIEVKKYFSVLSVVGDRDSASRGNSELTLKNNVFRTIGSKQTNSKGRIAFGAIRLINSSNNKIIGNQFIDIRNSEVCGGLHAIYLAHFSSKNKIINNVFDGTCGAPIKFRDRANGNIVENNKFVNLENVPALQEWFCDRVANKDCKKPAGECPSILNVERNNQFSVDSVPPIELMGRKVQRPWCSTKSFSGARIISQ